MASTQHPSARACTLLAFSCALALACHQAPRREARQAALHLEDLTDLPLIELNGRATRLGDKTGEVPVVLAYTGVGCPISGKYAAQLNRLAQRYGRRGVRFLGINASPQDTCREIAVDLEELDLEIEVLKDEGQELTRRLGGTTTTEVFLFDARGRLRYRGAIDDQYALGASKPAPTHTYLIDALEAVLAGRHPPTGTTPAPGCRLTLLPVASPSDEGDGERR